MISAVDIGNSTVVLGITSGSGIPEVHTFSADSESIPGLLDILVSRNIVSVSVCSVNPALFSRLQDGASQEHISIHMYNYTNIPLVNTYLSPEQVGSDRLTAAYAAYRKYGTDAVVVDIGTAVTFESVTAEGVYRGGAIFPGAGLCSKSLNTYTALLPLVDLGGDGVDLPGLSTEQSIKGGLLSGLSSAITGIVSILRECLGSECRVVLTGGDAPLFLDMLPSQWEYVPYLVLEGLFYLDQEITGNEQV